MNQQSSESNQDTYARDQLEHFKMELTGLRAENQRLADEVGYLRQALAAALSKIPQLEASTSSLQSSNPASSSSSAMPGEGWLWKLDHSLRNSFGYFSLATLLATPVVLFILLLLGVVCTLLFSLYLLMT